MAAEGRAPRSPLQIPLLRSRLIAGARTRSGDVSSNAGGRFGLTVFLVALCQLADLITFNFAVEMFGPSGELGPLGLVYRAGGFWAVAVVKLGLIAIVMAVLARYPWRSQATRRRMALIVGAVGAIGALTNATAFSLLR